MTQLLLVNGNTSETVTQKLVAEAQLYAGENVRICSVTARFGADLVSDRASALIAGHAILDAVAHYEGSYDGVLIAISLDTALEALRELLDVPVIGMTEAACFQACLVGSRFGVVMPGRHTLPMYRERILGYVLGERLAGMSAIDTSVQKHHVAPGDSEEAILAAIMGLIENEDSEAIVLAGASMTGLKHRLQRQVPVPLLDGIECGITLLESLIRLKLPLTRLNNTTRLTNQTLIGLSRDCSNLLNGSPLEKTP